MDLGLSGLALPPILPDEPPPIRTRIVEQCGPDVGIYVGDTMWYDQNGAPLLGSLQEVAEYVLSVQEAPGGSLRSRPFYRYGGRIVVQTSYLGIDMSTALGGPYPLVWETMVAALDRMYIFDQWRYATRAAAHAGHEQVVATLRDQQFERWRRRAGL
jgi:hypothetical protein